jgi:hypothetical protein
MALLQQLLERGRLDPDAAGDGVAMGRLDRWRRRDIGDGLMHRNRHRRARVGAAGRFSLGFAQGLRVDAVLRGRPRRRKSAVGALSRSRVLSKT